MGIVKALEMDGLDCRALFNQLGLDFEALDDPDARFPQDSMTRLWQLAVELSGNPAIGLNMGKVVRPASFHVAGYALMSSQTLAEGFKRLVRYQRIIAESADLSFRLLPEGYALILTVHGDHLPPTRQSAEASLACALGLCGWLVFDHTPGPLELAGIALIVLCGASASWLTAREKNLPGEPPEA